MNALFPRSIYHYRFRSWSIRLRERIALKIMFAMPDGMKDRIWLHRTGELTCTKPSLFKIPVPVVTVNEIINAMNEESA